MSIPNQEGAGEDVSAEDRTPPEPAKAANYNDGELTTLVVQNNPILRGEEADGELSGDRYYLKAPVFNGNEDVEQFIQEFSGVVIVSQWPTRAALLQLQLA